MNMFQTYHLDVKNRGVEFFVGFDPLAVQVNTGKVAPSVAVDDAIWVKHGDDLEYKVVTEYASS